MSEEIVIPPDFTQRTAARLGAAGRTWLAQLPGIIRECEESWNCVAGPPFSLTYNYVAPATLLDGTPAVLKLSFPEDNEFRSEIEALRIFAGRGIARLLAADVERGAMLLERLEPGTPLEAVQDDDAAVAVAARVMRDVWRPAPPGHAFPTLTYWASGIGRLLRSRFEGGTGPLPERLVLMAEDLFRELLASTEREMLLHGDLHHGNIREATRAPWLAIDPKGVVGDRAYEPAPFIINPWPNLLDRPNPQQVMARRIDRFAAALGIDRERIRAWATAHAVLSAVWCVDDNEAWEYPIACAEILASLR